MRFRAIVSDVSTFVQIVQAISKLSKKCVLKFSGDKMHLICNDDTEGGVQVWSQVNNSSIFSSHRIESNMNNEIYLIVSIPALLTVLRSALSMAGRGEVVVKLAKRPIGEKQVNKPILVWEIGGDTRHGRAPPLSHDLQIKIMKESDIQAIQEPLCPEPDIHILLPTLVTLRTVTEHLSKLSSQVLISANHNGDLRFEAGRGASQSIEVRTEWKALDVPRIVDNATQDQPSQPRPKDHFFSTSVAVKTLLSFLNAHVIQGATIACLCENHSLIMYLYIGEPDTAGGVLTFFIPAVSADFDG